MRLLALALTVAASALAGLAMHSGPAAAQQTLRVAGNFAVDHSSTDALNLFARELESATGGALRAEIFPAMQTGGASENVTAVRQGALIGTVVGLPFVSRVVPELDALGLPFVFPTREIAFKVADGEVGDILAEKAAEKGFVLFPMMELGYRHVTNNVRPIRTIEDFEGLKIRLQPSETHLETFRALGANPQPMDIKELYSALQHGVLDGQENPYSVILSWRFQEVQKYLSDTGQFFDFIVVVANKAQFEALSPEHQDAVRNAVIKAVEYQRAAAIEDDASSRAQLEAAGMQFDPIPDETRKEMQARTAGVVDTVRERLGAELVDLVVSQASGQ